MVQASPNPGRETVWPSGYSNSCKQSCYKQTRIKVNIYWKKCVSYVRAGLKIHSVQDHLSNCMRIGIKNHCVNDVIDGEIVRPLVQSTCTELYFLSQIIVKGLEIHLLWIVLTLIPVLVKLKHIILSTNKYFNQFTIFIKRHERTYINSC